MSNRRGFTLVEVIVAVVLLDVGLLALVAASTVLVAQMNELTARSAALYAASDRLQQLGAGACAPQSGSALSASNVREWWTVTRDGDATRDIRDSVAFLVGGTPRSIVLRTRLPC